MFLFIKDSVILKPIALLLAISVSFISFANRKDTITLKAGTMIPAKTKTMLNSANLTVGKTVDFIVSKDIVVDGKIVVEAGSSAKGQVVRVSPAKGLGKAGFVAIEMKSVTAIDGSQVYINGDNIYQEGEDKETLALVLGLVVCILFLTIKGKDAIIPQGYDVSPIVAASAEINID